MTENELLKIILERLGYSDNAQAIFAYDEINNWPDGAVDLFIKNGILQAMKPAASVECQGCEENCIMEVNKLPAENKKPARAFIACDKHNDVGRIPVDFCQLQQWQISGSLLADTLNKLLMLSQSTLNNSIGKEWKLGMLKGKKRNDYLVLSMAP
jgi:hypothetical protein